METEIESRWPRPFRLVDMSLFNNPISSEKADRLISVLGASSIGRNGGFRNDKLVTYGGESPENILVYPGDLYVSSKRRYTVRRSTRLRRSRTDAAASGQPANPPAEDPPS